MPFVGGLWPTPQGMRVQGLRDGRKLPPLGLDTLQHLDPALGASDPPRWCSSVGAFALASCSPSAAQASAQAAPSLPPTTTTQSLCPPRKAPAIPIASQPLRSSGVVADSVTSRRTTSGATGYHTRPHLTLTSRSVVVPPPSLKYLLKCAIAHSFSCRICTKSACPPPVVQLRR
jgi:hypothetical protein